MTIEEWLKDVKYDKDGGPYIWNSDGEMVCSIRGWGTLQYKFSSGLETEQFQGKVGEFIAQAIREKLDRF